MLELVSEERESQRLEARIVRVPVRLAHPSQQLGVDLLSLHSSASTTTPSASSRAKFY